MFIAELPADRSYPPPGRCIYCWRDDVALTDEHIIPYALWGSLVFEQASCRACAKIIQSYEAPTLNRTFIKPRTKLNLPVRAAKYRPKALRVFEMGEEGTPFPRAPGPMREVPVDDYPFTILLPLYEPPGVFRMEVDASEPKMIGLRLITPHGQGAGKVNGKRAGHEMLLNDVAFFRFLAKIGHGAACAELGIDNFTPLLPRIVRCESPFLASLIGSPRLDQQDKQEPDSSLHKISLWLERGYIIARVRLFAAFGAQYYQVVVGRPGKCIAGLSFEVRSIRAPLRPGAAYGWRVPMPPIPGR